MTNRHPRWFRTTGLAVLLAVSLVLPFLVESPYLMHLFIMTFVGIILGMSFSMIFSTGLISLGVATFYAQFRFHPPGKHHIHACMGTACHVRGGQQLLNTLEHRLGVRDGETTPDRQYDLNRVACLGCCALAPVVKIDEKVYSQLSVLKLRELLDEYDQA